MKCLKCDGRGRVWLFTEGTHYPVRCEPCVGTGKDHSYLFNWFKL